MKTLIEQNQGLQNSIQELERTKVMVQEQAGMYQRLAALRNPGEAASSSARGPETNAERLQRMRTYLIELQGKYTEKHPEVRRTKQMIAQLEGGKEQSSSGPRTVSSPNRANVAADLERQRMLVQLQQIDINIKQLRETQAGIPAQIAKYQRWVEAAPIREAEWNSLTRDYNELRRHYDQLVAQNLQAQSTQNIEQSQKGSKFKVVDSARLPEKPVKPNFLKILLVAVGAGLGFSFICILGLDFADTSFRDVGEIEEYVGVPVVCAIPFIEKEAERLKKRFLFRISVAVVSAYGAILLATIAYMWSTGMIIV
jgi:uncharacterized protein involved in exopolysaccharide biosynthesis